MSQLTDLYNRIKQLESNVASLSTQTDTDYQNLLTQVNAMEATVNNLTLKVIRISQKAGATTDDEAVPEQCTIWVGP
jgi:DNA-binding FrmR family transcriptional regulator